MLENDNITITSSSIIPMVDINETQLIFERHCNYDRKNARLIDSSIEKQKLVVHSFIECMKASFTIEDLQNTYFLFASSNTISAVDFKRCVETTNIAVAMIKQFFKEHHISNSHIINLNEDSNYHGNMHESRHLTELLIIKDIMNF